MLVSYRSTLHVLIALFLPTNLVAGQEWSRFRGPNGTGLASQTSLPHEWTQADFNWKVKLPGKGHASPVVWNEKIFVMSAHPESATRYVLCLSTIDGSTIWQRNFPSRAHRLHRRNTYASSTPAVDSERVYVAWSDPSKVTLMAMDHDGKTVWALDLGSWTSQHGFGTSPILYQDLVILSNSQQKEGLEPGQEPGISRVMAFDAKSGELRWETPRASVSVCYSTPSIYRPTGGPSQLINTSTGDGLYSLDPKSGKELWKIGEAFEKRVVSSPVIAGDIVFGSTGSGGGGNYLTAVRLGPQPEVLYTIRSSAPYVPTVVAKDGLAFLFSDRGVASCIEVESGNTLWRERLNSPFSGSPIIADDKVFCISEEGTVFVLAASREFRLLATNPLGEPSRSTPAVAGRRIYLRTESHLHSVGGSVSVLRSGP